MGSCPVAQGGVGCLGEGHRLNVSAILGSQPPPICPAAASMRCNNSAVVHVCGPMQALSRLDSALRCERNQRLAARSVTFVPFLSQSVLLAYIEALRLTRASGSVYWDADNSPRPEPRIGRRQMAKLSSMPSLSGLVAGAGPSPVVPSK